MKLHLSMIILILVIVLVGCSIPSNPPKPLPNTTILENVTNTTIEPVVVTRTITCSSQSILGSDGSSFNGFKSPDIKKIALSANTFCVLFHNGNISCKGSNVYHESESYTLGDAKDISLGRAIQCILKNDNSIICKGENEDSRIPSYNNKDVLKVYAGYDNVCILKMDGSTQCWGRNAVLMKPIMGVKDLAVGLWDFCVIKNDGSVFCEGLNVDYLKTWSSVPYTGKDAVSITEDSTNGNFCVLKTDKTVACFSPYHNSFNYNLKPVKQVSISQRGQYYLHEDGTVYGGFYGGNQALQVVSELNSECVLT